MHSFAAKLTFVASLGLTVAQSQINVDTSTKYQTIDGFGFSEAFGFGTGVADAPAEQQNETLNYLFSTTNGAGFTILRNRISPNLAPNTPASSTAALEYSWDGKDASQVWWSHRAREMGVKYIYADAWSAPGYMKTNGKTEDGGSLCGVHNTTCESGDWRQSYADLLVNYIKFYEAEGITIDFVGFLNEPEFSPDYDSMLADGLQSSSFIPVLHETVKQAGLTTGITCCDAMGWSDQVKWTAQLIETGTHDYLARITSHWYAEQGKAPMDTSLRVWETEFADLSGDFCSTWYSTGAKNEGLTWAGFIYQGLAEANLSAFLYWIGAQANGNAATLINLSGSGASTTVTPSGILWAFSMFSRYVRPDAIRVATSGAPNATKVAAFQNVDGSIVVVMLNEGAEGQEVSLGGCSLTYANAYFMDNSVSSPTGMLVSVSSGKVKATLPKYSVVTFVLTASKNYCAVAVSSSIAASSSTAVSSSIAKTSFVATLTSVLPTNYPSSSVVGYPSISTSTCRKAKHAHGSKHVQPSKYPTEVIASSVSSYSAVAPSTGNGSNSTAAFTSALSTSTNDGYVVSSSTASQSTAPLPNATTYSFLTVTTVTVTQTSLTCQVPKTSSAYPTTLTSILSSATPTVYFSSPKTPSSAPDPDTSASSITYTPVYSAPSPITPTSASKAPVAQAPEETTSTSGSARTAEKFFGMGTRYGGDCKEEDCWQNGACSFVDYTLPAGIDGSTCVSNDIWDNSAQCGGCISVTYKGKTLTIMVTNRTGGNATHLDMTPDTWAKLTNGYTGGGVPQIEWEWTTCPIPETSPLVIRMHAGASKYWFAATVENARYRTAKLEVSGDGGNTWQETTRDSVNFFVLDGGLSSDTAMVKVTGITGSEVIVNNVTLASNMDTTATENYA